MKNETIEKKVIYHNSKSNPLLLLKKEIILKLKGKYILK